MNLLPIYRCGQLRPGSKSKRELIWICFNVPVERLPSCPKIGASQESFPSLCYD